MESNLHRNPKLLQASMSVNDVPAKRYYCGKISIRPSIGQVMVGEQIARLTPLNMKVLAVLLDNAGEVVSRTEIHRQVWANLVVSDDTLTRAISDIRALFKSLSLENKLIETIPKKGYRWLDQCSTEPEMAFDDNNSKGAPAQPSAIQLEGSSLVTNLLDKTDLPEIRKIEPIANLSNWYRWVLWFFVATALFSILAASTIWLVKSQFSDRYKKIAMVPVVSDSPEHDELVNVLSEKLQQRVLKTKDIRFLSSRMASFQQQSLVPYLADEFSVSWLIDVEIRESAGLTKVTLNLVEAQSAVVLESASQKIQSEQIDTDSLVERFINRLVQISE